MNMLATAENPMETSEDALVPDAAELSPQVPEWSLLYPKLGLRKIDLRVGLDVARTQLQRGDIAGAFNSYVALVLCDPSEPEYQLGFANCALHLGEAALALHATSVALALSPTNAWGYCISARACIALGQLSDAREDLIAAIEHARASNDTKVLADAKYLLAKLDKFKD